MSRRQFGGYPPAAPKKQAAVPLPSTQTRPNPPAAPSSVGASNSINRAPAKSPFQKTQSSPGVTSNVASGATPSAAPTTSSLPASNLKRPVSAAPKTASVTSIVRPVSAGATVSSTIVSSPASSASNRPALAGTTLVIKEPALGQLNSTYTFAKGNLAQNSASAEEKLKFILASTDEKISNNAIIISSQILECGQGINFFANLLLATEEAVVRNVCNALTNFAQQPAVITAITTVGFSRLLTVMRNSKDKSPFLRLLCNCLNNEKTSVTFIKQGGLIAALDILAGSSHSFDETSAALMIANNAVASVKDNLFVFAEENTLRALVSSLKAKLDPDAQSIVVRILVSVTNDDVNRTLFVKLGVMSDLAKILSHPESTQDAKLNQMLVRLVGNLLKGSTSSKHAVNSGAMEFLARSLQSTDADVVLPALAAIANFALNDKILADSCERIVSGGIFAQLNRLVSATTRPAPPREVRVRAAITISNLMTIDSLQRTFDQSGGTAALISAASSQGEDEEIRLKALGGLFHLSMYSDSVRSQIVARGGLKVLTDALAAPGAKQDLKAAAAKALVNLSLNDETEAEFVSSGAIKPLVNALQDAKAGTEFQSLASMCLENLSYNNSASDAIREAGGIDFALKCLGDTATTAAASAMQERSIKLLSKLAINGKNRKVFQDKGGPELLKKAMGRARDSNLKQLGTVALNNMSVPHFEDVYSSIGRDSDTASTGSSSSSAALDGDNFDELKGFGLGEDEDLDLGTDPFGSFRSSEPERETAPQMPVSDDEDDEVVESSFYRDLIETDYPPQIPEDDEYEEEAGNANDDFDPAPQLEEEEESDVIIHHDVEQPSLITGIPLAQSSAPIAVPKRPAPVMRQNTLPYRPAPPKKPTAVPPRTVASMSSLPTTETEKIQHVAVEEEAQEGGAEEVEVEFVEEEEDRGLKKELYMLAEDSSSSTPSGSGGRRAMKTRITQFISRIREKITGTETNEIEEAAAAALPMGPWKVQEERVTNRCAAVIFDWYDYWCDSCKKDGSTCAKEFDELRGLRKTLIKDRIPKTYKAGTRVVNAEPFLPASAKSVATAGVRFAPETSTESSSSSTSTFENPPSDPPPAAPVSLSSSAPTQSRAPITRTLSSQPPPALPPKPERYRGNSVTTDDSLKQITVANPPGSAAAAPVKAPPAAPLTRVTSAPLPKSSIQSLGGARPQSVATKPLNVITTTPTAPPKRAPVAPTPVSPKQQTPTATIAPKKAPAAAPIKKIISLKELPPDADPARVAAAKQHFKRTRIVQELLETEGSYVKSLAVMVKKFQNPLLNMATSPKPLATEADIRTMFSSIEIIFSINSMLLEGLNAKMRKWSSKQTVGDVFLFMGDFLKTYTDYINHYDTSQTTVLRCMQENPRFMRFLEDMAADPVCKGLGLPSLLVMPVQRVPRYSLLLRELIKNTSPDHPDHKNIVGACDKVDKVAAYLNEKRKEFDSRLKLGEIAYSLLGEIREIVQPHREFVAEYATSWEMQHPQNGKMTGKGKLFLFNDAILICKQSSKTKQKMKKLAFLTAISSAMATPGGQGWQAVLGNSGERLNVFFSSPTDQAAFLEKYHNLTDPARASRIIRMT